MSEPDRAQKLCMYAGKFLSMRSGKYSGQLAVIFGEETCRIPVSIEVLPAIVPEKETLSVTNWFSLPNMAKRYNLEPWSEEHWTMIRRYGELMRESRQTHFGCQRK